MDYSTIPAYEYADRALPYTKWLIPHFLPSVGVVLLQGKAFAGKSYLALQMANAVHRGEKFFGHEATRADTLYLMLEAEFAWHVRIRELCQDYKIALDFHVPEPRTRPKTIDIRSPETWNWFKGSIEALNPRLVIIDPIRELSSHDENDSKEMKQLFSIIEPVLGNRCLLINHHERKPPPGMGGAPTTDSATDAGRGTYLPGKADVLLWLQSWNEGERGKVSITSRYTDSKKYFLQREKSGLWVPGSSKG